MVSTKETYLQALKKLFPRGSYWDEQFENPDSDVLNLLELKAEELLEFRKKMAYLLDESTPYTAEDTFDHWEELFTGTVNSDLGMEERKELVFSQRSTNVSTESLKTIARMYGVEITRLYFPFRPGIMGHSRFGIDRMGSPAVLSVIVIEVSKKPDKQAAFEKHITNTLLANQIIYFQYPAEENKAESIVEETE